MERVCPHCGEVLIKQSLEEWYCPECNEVFLDEELEVANHQSDIEDDDDEDW
jgi:uncharacterized Zn finger protein (UPF0148 family)